MPNAKSDLETRLSDLESQMARLVAPSQIFTGQITEFKGTPASGGRGPQLSFTMGNFNQLAEVSILRNVSRDPNTAKTMQTWTHLSPSSTDFHSWNDSDPSIVGTKPFYWVEVNLTNPDAAPMFFGPIQVQA